MQHRIMKLLLVCVFLYKLQIVELSSLNRWRQQDQRYQPERYAQREEAAARRIDERFSWITENDQLPFMVESPTMTSSVSRALRNRVPSETSEVAPKWIRLSARSSCSCESQYGIRDLGDGHYPRYLTASNCKSKTCHSKFHSCKLLQYMVYVLRLRESSTPFKEWYAEGGNLQEPIAPEPPLPESLRHKWQLKPISVAVACVPTTDGKRN